MDKMIDKLIDNRWFIRAVSLILALLLFDYVYDGEDLSINVPQDEDSATIEDVAVKSYYDIDNLVVTGVPKTVTVTITGPKNLVQQAKTSQSFEVYVDLANAEIGTQKVPIEVKDVSDRLEVTIDPDYADVSIQEKVTQEFKIEAEYDVNQVAKGYLAGKAEVKPNKVKITGAKDVIEQITYVKATIDLEESLTETVTKEAKILVLDRDLNKLDVELETETVEVSIPVKASSKKVPIRIVEKGTVPSGVTITSMELDQSEATIVAEESVLTETDSVRVEIDVSSIEDDTVITLPVIISDDIVKVDPQTVEVTITVDTTEDVSLTKVPITVVGLADSLEMGFNDPSDGTVTITASGKSEIVQSLIKEDFNISLDVTNLTEGVHDVALNVTGPTSVQWRISQATAQITLARRGA